MNEFWTNERIAALRAATPGTSHVAHFNNAGSALMSAAVHGAMLAHLDLELRTGGYEAAAEAASKVEATYDSAARLMGCDPSELAIVESATRAWSSALSAINLQPGDNIITAASEYVSNAMGLIRAIDRYGIELRLAPNDENGQVDVDAMGALIDDRTKVIALTHVPTQGGLVQPAAAVGALAADADVLYLLDACQSVGQLRVDVDEVQADITTFTGRKFLRAPRGTGMIHVRASALERIGNHVGLDAGSSDWVAPLRVELAPSARRFAPFEMTIAAKVAFGVAFDELLELGIDNVEQRVRSLGADLRSGLEALDGVRVHDLGIDPCGIVTFAAAAETPLETKVRLAAENINVSVTQAGSSQFDLPTRGLDSLVRASVHYYNTTDEISRLVEVVSRHSAR